MNGALRAVLALLLVHAALIWMPPVNNEFAFADAALFFAGGERNLLDSFLAFQANTLGMPVVAGALLEALPGLSALWALRIASLAGVALLGLAVMRLGRALELEDGSLLALLVLANPLVWTYGGRGTADLLPAAVGVLALALAVEQPLAAGRAALAGSLFATAALLKYHALLLLPVALLVHYARFRRLPAPTALASIGLAALVPLMLYLVLVQRVLGFWLVPPRFQGQLSLVPGDALANFVCYAGYLSMLVLPAIVFGAPARDLLRRRHLLFTGIALAAFAAGSALLRDNGEMNLGPLDALLAAPLRMGLFGLAACGLLLPVFLPAGGVGSWLTPRRALWTGCVLVILALSATRPAQRYLLFVLPLFVLCIDPRLLLARASLVPMLLLFTVANGFVEYSRWCTGTATRRMVEEIDRRGLLQSTDPGAIIAHDGGRFLRAASGAPLYKVVDGAPAGALVVATAGYEPLARKYALVSMPASN